MLFFITNKFISRFARLRCRIFFGDLINETLKRGQKNNEVIALDLRLSFFPFEAEGLFTT